MPDKHDSLSALSAEVLATLLRDHTTGQNIFWATHDYEVLGSAYDYHAEILPELVTGEHGMVVRPRVLKSKENQTDRSKDMAEVFTPSWICNEQNNLVIAPLISPQRGEEWKRAIRTTCLEITCGEAPYLVSRYDSTTGESIPLQERIGLLDRKLRIVSAHTETSEEWFEWARIAYQSTYGYEWQGDNLLLARQALLLSFVEYYEAKFHEVPSSERINEIADIISWNLWQMDGLKYGIPGYEPTECLEDSFCNTFFPPAPEERYCRIRDWEVNEEILYINLLNGK